MAFVGRATSPNWIRKYFFAFAAAAAIMMAFFAFSCFRPADVHHSASGAFTSTNFNGKGYEKPQTPEEAFFAELDASIEAQTDFKHEAIKAFWIRSATEMKKENETTQVKIEQAEQELEVKSKELENLEAKQIKTSTTLRKAYNDFIEGFTLARLYSPINEGIIEIYILLVNCKRVQVMKEDLNHRHGQLKNVKSELFKHFNFELTNPDADNLKSNTDVLKAIFVENTTFAPKELNELFGKVKQMAPEEFKKAFGSVEGFTGKAMDGIKDVTKEALGFFADIFSKKEHLEKRKSSHQSSNKPSDAPKMYEFNERKSANRKQIQSAMAKALMQSLSFNPKNEFEIDLSFIKEESSYMKGLERNLYLLSMWDVDPYKDYRKIKDPVTTAMEFLSEFEVLRVQCEDVDGKSLAASLQKHINALKKKFSSSTKTTEQDYLGKLTKNLITQKVRHLNLMKSISGEDHFKNFETFTIFLSEAKHLLWLHGLARSDAHLDVKVLRELEEAIVKLSEKSGFSQFVSKVKSWILQKKNWIYRTKMRGQNEGSVYSLMMASTISKLFKNGLISDGVKEEFFKNLKYELSSFPVKIWSCIKEGGAAIMSDLAKPIVGFLD